VQRTIPEFPCDEPARGEPIEILLVEDSADDADLTVDALRDGRVRNRVTVVEDGVEAMAYLRRKGKYAAAPRPDLILLDLNLPRKNGRRCWRKSSRTQNAAHPRGDHDELGR